MGDLGVGGWTALIGVLAGLVALATLLTRVIEKLIKDRRKDAETASKYPKLTRSGNTTDIALQSNSIRVLTEDLAELRKAVYDIKSTTTKDIPHTLERLEGKIDAVVSFQKEEATEMNKVLRGLKNSLDGNTSATSALKDFLAARLKRE